MDYEKAYKAVLKTATQWIKDGCTDKEKICLECVFPELRESEDEKVRKCLIAMVNATIWDSSNLASKKACLAWLENQKEPHYTKRNALFDKCVAECDPAVMKEVSDKVDEMLGKEQKSAWSEEDERIRLACIATINDVIDYERDRWEDYNPGKPYRPITEYDEQIDWLKSLRPSWKPSEDEERLINTSISFLKDFADKGYENAVECIDWLKSKLNGNTCK